MTRKQLLTRGIVAGAAVLVATAAVLSGGERRATTRPSVPPTGSRPLVEVVFVLDTTGSMGGLIRGAKEKIWDIAKHIGRGQPTPDLRVGLVAFRDHGDEYVTRTFPLTSDLDAVYAELSSYKADGGGDEPEAVGRALHDAVNRFSWSPNAMKMVFLVGDAPPHTYDRSHDSRAIAAHASERGIRVNAIRCGDSAQTARAWTEIAHAGGGVYGSIAQGGGVATVATPYDGELAALGRAYSDTAVIVGDDGVRARVAAKAEGAASAPAPVAADRSGFFALSGAGIDESDKLGAFASAPAAIAATPTEALPEPMRELKPEQRKHYVDKKMKEREEISRKISDLTKKRDEFVKKATEGKEDGFDDVVKGAVTKDAGRYGIKYGE